MLLAIGTAHRACSLALFGDDGGLVRHRHELIGRGHAERLLPMIADLLGEDRPSEIVVEIGPGSFTGIRVGIAAARALGLAWNVPVRGVLSTELLASEAREAGSASDLTVLLDGGRGEVFRQHFGPEGAIDRPQAIPAIDARPETATIIGTGAPLVPKHTAEDLGAATPDMRFLPGVPETARGLVPSPLYVRAPDAKLPRQ